MRQGDHQEEKKVKKAETQPLFRHKANIKEAVEEANFDNEAD